MSTSECNNDADMQKKLFSTFSTVGVPMLGTLASQRSGIRDACRYGKHVEFIIFRFYCFVSLYQILYCKVVQGVACSWYVSLDIAVL